MSAGSALADAVSRLGGARAVAAEMARDPMVLGLLGGGVALAALLVLVNPLRPRTSRAARVAGPLLFLGVGLAALPVAFRFAAGIAAVCQL